MLIFACTLECMVGPPLISMKTKQQPKAAKYETKRHILSIDRDVAKLSVNSGDFDHDILSVTKKL